MDAAAQLRQHLMAAVATDGGLNQAQLLAAHNLAVLQQQQQQQQFSPSSSQALVMQSDFYQSALALPIQNSTSTGGRAHNARANSVNMQGVVAPPVLDPGYNLPAIREG